MNHEPEKVLFKFPVTWQCRIINEDMYLVEGIINGETVFLKSFHEKEFEKLFHYYDESFNHMSKEDVIKTPLFLRNYPTPTGNSVYDANVLQKSHKFHPMTCPGENVECQTERNLIATPDKWVCFCGKYTQEYRNIE